MILQDKVAVIYGAGGAIGGAVACAFAAEGARLFLTGRRRASVEVVAKELAGAEVAEVDALDERAVDGHLESVVARAGRVDIAFDAVGLPNPELLGVPLTELAAELFARPIAAYPMAYFLTARLAARRMIPAGSGVIMTVTALPARMGSRLNGGYGPSQAAKEALTRDLSAELAPQGIRVVGLRAHGMPETRTMREAFDAKTTGATWAEFQAYLAGTTHPRRVMTLADVAGAAVLVASGRASGLTGTTVNLTMGSLDD
ncbi:short-chain dehydrogenase [Amorphoplanes nipponensis]|uniref:Short-chain dehydrogenase n=1 Tax=Actinoplanes nipponensis TaxID=135950 RepID=A0A919JC41_9ACTN|nr:SDR family oxidoreductase [Actinoplanes nipponensis]GIE46471.1 short-chain dehydrogenase [Actinoplanes nipponensis]